MKLLEPQVTADSLAELAAEAVRLLCRGELDTLAGRYGYALSYGREPATAIREDLARCLSKIGATSLAVETKRSAPRVVFYKPSTSNPVAVIECLARGDNGADILIELVVTSRGPEKHITLEDLSVA
jgi:hypothetical protein